MAAGVTVAVVEDDEDTRLVLREVLEDAGYTVVEADTGPAGLALLRATSEPVVVVLDEYLPGLSGTGLLRNVVADGVLRRHRYIICTASPRANPERLALRRQLDAPLLGKPFDVDELLRLVSEAAATLP